MWFEPATPGFWDYETPAQLDAERKLPKTSLKHLYWSNYNICMIISKNILIGNY